MTFQNLHTPISGHMPIIGLLNLWTEFDCYVIRQSHYRKNVNILWLIETLATMRVSQTFSIIRHPSDFNVAYRFFLNWCSNKPRYTAWSFHVRKYWLFILCTVLFESIYHVYFFCYARYRINSQWKHFCLIDISGQGKVKYNQIFATFTWKMMIRFFDIISCLKTKYSNKKAKET